MILGNFSVQATADIESKTYRQTRMYKLVNASKEEGLVRTPGTHLLPPASMTRFPVLLLPKSSRGARVWLCAPRLFAGLGHFAPLRECISPASAEPPCRSFPTGVSAGRAPWQGARHPRRVFHRTSEKGLPSLPGRFLWAKCAERNRYLPRHHFPRAWRLCPPNLAGEPPFAAPRGRSLDTLNYEPSPESCQEKRDRTRINLDAPQAANPYNLFATTRVTRRLSMQTPWGRLRIQI